MAAAKQTAKRPRKSARRTPTQERARALADAILTAASQILEDRGYRGTTTTLVAERAGVSIGSLYQYFPDKEALLVAVLARELGVNKQRFDSLIAGGGSVLAGMVARFYEKRRIFRILQEDAPASIRIAGQQRIRQGYLDAIVKILEKLPPANRPRDPAATAFVMLHAVIGVLNGAVLADPPMAGLSASELVPRLEALVAGYLQNELTRLHAEPGPSA